MSSNVAGHVSLGSLIRRPDSHLPPAAAAAAPHAGAGRGSALSASQRGPGAAGPGAHRRGRSAGGTSSASARVRLAGTRAPFPRRVPRRLAGTRAGDTSRATCGSPKSGPRGRDAIAASTPAASTPAPVGSFVRRNERPGELKEAEASSPEAEIWCCRCEASR